MPTKVTKKQVPFTQATVTKSTLFFTYVRNKVDLVPLVCEQVSSYKWILLFGAFIPVFQSFWSMIKRMKNNPNAGGRSRPTSDSNQLLLHFEFGTPSSVQYILTLIRTASRKEPRLTVRFGVFSYFRSSHTDDLIATKVGQTDEIKVYG